MSVPPRLRSDLVVVDSQIDGATVFTIKDPITGRYFRMREPEYWLVRQLDGCTTTDTIAVRFREKFGFDLAADDVGQFVAHLGSLAFLEDGRSEQEIAKALKEQQRKRSLASRVLFIQFSAFKPGPFLDRLARLYRPFHSPIWFTLQTLLVLAGLILLYLHSPVFAVSLSEVVKASSLVMLVLAIFILVGLHEFAHAVVCRYYGGQVREMGFLLMYFQPCFYCDVSDAWLFPKKSQRLAVTWAGPWFQLTITALSLLIWRVTVPGTGVNELARLISFVGALTFLLNFNPLIKLDGYYLLSDWLEIPNLRLKSFAFFGNWLQRAVLGWPVSPAEASRREKRIYITYAVGALVYSTALVIYFLVLIGGFLHERLGGLGILLLAAAFAAIIQRPIAAAGRGAVQHGRHMKTLLHKPVRLTVYLVLILALVVVLFFVPFPHRVSGEIFVQPVEEFALTMAGDGILESWYRRGGATPEKKSGLLQMTTSDMAVLNVLPIIQENQVVRPGDTVAVISSNQVIQESEEALAELNRLEAELALLKTPRKKEEIAEAAAQVKAAQATLDQLQREYTRTNQLFDRNLIAKEQLEAAKASVDIASAELTKRKAYHSLVKSPPRPEEEVVLQHQIGKQKARISYLQRQADAQVVVTPIAGVASISRRGDTILSITNAQQVELMVPVSDFDIDLVQRDQMVTAKVRAYPSKVYSGQVVRIPSQAGEHTSTAKFPVCVLVPNLDNSLRPGMTGYAKIDIGSASAAYLISRKALSTVRVEFWSWW